MLIYPEKSEIIPPQRFGRLNGLLKMSVFSIIVFMNRGYLGCGRLLLKKIRIVGIGKYNSLIFSTKIFNPKISCSSNYQITIICVALVSIICSIRCCICSKQFNWKNLLMNLYLNNCAKYAVSSGNR